MYKRERTNLGYTAVQKRYIKETSINHFINGGLSKKVLDSENKLRRKQANKAKCEVQWNWKYQTPSKSSTSIESLGSINARTSPGFYSLRRQAIHYFFLLFGSALQEDWDKLGLVHEIMLRCEIDRRRTEQVKNILLNILKSQDKKQIYDPNGAYRHGDRDALIHDMDSDAKLIYQWISDGLSVIQCTMLLNQIKESEGKPLLCFSAVNRFISKSKMIVTSSRETKVYISLVQFL